MSGNILTRDVRAKLGVAVSLTVENEAILSALSAGAILLGAQEEAQFERHVEPRESGDGIELSPREVVDAELTLSNDLGDRLKANAAAIADLE